MRLVAGVSSSFSAVLSVRLDDGLDTSIACHTTRKGNENGMYNKIVKLKIAYRILWTQTAHPLERWYHTLSNFNPVFIVWRLRIGFDIMREVWRRRQWFLRTGAWQGRRQGNYLIGR